MYKYVEYIIHGSNIWLFCKTFHKLCSKVLKVIKAVLLSMTPIVFAGTGRLEPVPIQVKTGRGGLGREVFQKRKNEERLVMRAQRAQKRARHEERHRQDFRKRFSEKMGDRQVEQDLLKSQKVCGELDAQKVCFSWLQCWFFSVSQYLGSVSELAFLYKFTPTAQLIVYCLFICLDQLYKRCPLLQITIQSYAILIEHLS